MTDTQVTTQLSMHWVQVTNADGSTRLEARWGPAGQPSTLHTHAAA